MNEDPGGFYKGCAAFILTLLVLAVTMQIVLGVYGWPVPAVP